jgi:hypothetical protein
MEKYLAIGASVASIISAVIAIKSYCKSKQNEKTLNNLSLRINSPNNKTSNSTKQEVSGNNNFIAGNDIVGNNNISGTDE